MLHVRAGAPQRDSERTDALNYSPTPPLDHSRKLIIHPRVPHSTPAADVITTPVLLPVDCLSLLIHKAIRYIGKNTRMWPH